MRVGRQAGLLGLVAVLAGPVQAECLGSCADSLVGALIAILVYGIIGLVVLVMLIREKWRRRGLKLLVLTILAAVGVPLLSQGWAWWKLQATEGREIVGTMPDLNSRTPLFLSGTVDACYYDACALFLLNAGETGTFALPISALEGLETGKPLDLADLPLELWQRPSDGSSTPRSRPLTPEERLSAASQIDYLMVLRKSWYAENNGPIETGLRQRPELASLRDTELANIVMGPISGGKLDLVGMQIDLLDLWLDHRALALILAPYNTQDAGNTIAGHDAVLAALCSEAAQAQQWDCEYALR
ncbi:MAG: hypothetical protein JNK19_18320 [Tabrizicola sp.]|nr:hypothetical protein [Tabrizicola sp.]